MSGFPESKLDFDAFFSQPAFLVAVDWCFPEVERVADFCGFPDLEPVQGIRSLQELVAAAAACDGAVLAVLVGLLGLPELAAVAVPLPPGRASHAPEALDDLLFGCNPEVAFAGVFFADGSRLCSVTQKDIPWMDYELYNPADLTEEL